MPFFDRIWCLDKVVYVLVYLLGFLQWFSGHLHSSESHSHKELSTLIQGNDKFVRAHGGFAILKIVNHSLQNQSRVEQSLHCSPTFKTTVK